MSDAGALLRFFRLAGRLKETPRAGWALRGVADAESVADHSFRLALLAFVLAPRAEAGLDRERCVALALAHDLAECEVGDITPYDGVSAEEKRRREAEAMRRLDALAGEAGLFDLWAEYDAAATPEARFVKELDKLETAMQADEYAASGAAPADGLREFHRNAERRVTTPLLRALLDALGGGTSRGPGEG
ncbi:MAG TPA: HD domain-containing protein [Longimicrobium sp.]|nr:HD domain-containing protein [Longimicrobium sp.]